MKRPTPTAGEINYITPQGLKRIEAEIRELKHVERPNVVKTVTWAAENGDRSENADYQYGKKRLREIDRRVEFLIKRLECAQVVNPAEIKSDEVLFGATVTVLGENQNRHIYKIVGVDEVDLDRSQISWRSPIAQAMFKKRTGDVVEFTTPKGTREIEIIGVEYRNQE